MDEKTLSSTYWGSVLCSLMATSDYRGSDNTVGSHVVTLPPEILQAPPHQLIARDFEWTVAFPSSLHLLLFPILEAIYQRLGHSKTTVTIGKIRN